MELIYMAYKLEKQDNFQQLNFGGEYILELSTEKGKNILKFNKNNNYIKNFFNYGDSSNVKNVTCIVGENTSGKTRTLRIIADILKYIEQIRMDKKHINEYDEQIGGSEKNITESNISDEEIESFKNKLYEINAEYIISFVDSHNKYRVFSNIGINDDRCYFNNNISIECSELEIQCESIECLKKIDITPIRTYCISPVFDFNESILGSISGAYNKSVNYMMQEIKKDVTYEDVLYEKRDVEYNLLKDLNQDFDYEGLFKDSTFINKISDIKGVGIELSDIKFNRIDFQIKINLSKKISNNLDKKLLQYFYGYIRKELEDLKEIKNARFNYEVNDLISIYSVNKSLEKNNILGVAKEVQNNILEKLNLNVADIEKIANEKNHNDRFFYLYQDLKDKVKQNENISDNLELYIVYLLNFIGDFKFLLEMIIECEDYFDHELQLFKFYFKQAEIDRINDFIQTFKRVELDNNKLIYINFITSKGIDNMSSGESTLLFQVANLYKIINNDDESRVILIDEGEMYLHPKWQLEYLKIILMFTSYFGKQGNTQFILTSNSPFLLTNLPLENIIFLGERKNKSNTFSANIQTLLYDDFFLDSFVGEFAKDKIQDTIKFLSGEKSNITDIKTADNIINMVGENIIKNVLLQKRQQYIENNEDNIKKEIERLTSLLGQGESND